MYLNDIMALNKLYLVWYGKKLVERLRILSDVAVRQIPPVGELFLYDVFSSIAISPIAIKQIGVRTNFQNTCAANGELWSNKQLA